MSARAARTAAFSAGERGQLVVGRGELAHWLNGIPIRAFQLHTAGAPILYPPLDALADSIGGLVATRVLSLIFVLIATVILWSLMMRLAGRRSAVLACVTWVALGSAVQLGAAASAGAACVCLIAVASWCVVRAGAGEDETGWMLAAAGALLLANATSYGCVVFDPVVAGMAIAVAWPVPGPRYAVMRGLSLLAYVTTSVVLLLTADGSYEIGIGRCMLATLPGLGSHLNGRPWALAWPVLGVVGLAGYVGRKLEPYRQALLAFLLGGSALLPLARAGVLGGPDVSALTGGGGWLGAIAVSYAADIVLGSIQVGSLGTALNSPERRAQGGPRLRPGKATQ